MCRILWVRAERPFQMAAHLERFADVSKNSSEYQGHGWGCAWLDGGEWRLHHNLQPVWDEDFSQFGATTLLLAHARSAFRDEGIRVENNMPFCDGKRVFIFNGELQGVRIKEEGRIGAEKIFNYIKRFDHHNLQSGLEKSVKVIEKRTRYIRAMNLIIASRESSELATLYNESPAYFQMHRIERNGVAMVCSVPYPGEDDWQPIRNHTIQTL